jgi:ATP-dependent RNA helicase RhlE
LCKGGIEATAIHGNKSQPARTKALAGFKAGTVRVLVATDIAARGLDIEELPHVVNFDLPHVAEDYVHRIGRTGRAGSTGEAISLVSHEEQPLLAAIEKLIGRRIDRQPVPGFEQGPALAQQSPSATAGPRAGDANRRGQSGQRAERGGHNRSKLQAASSSRTAPHAAASPAPQQAPARSARERGGAAPSAALLGGARRRTG